MVRQLSWRIAKNFYLRAHSSGINFLESGFKNKGKFLKKQKKLPETNLRTKTMFTWWGGVALSVQRPGYMLDDRGYIPGRCNDKIFLFATASRPAMKPTRPQIQRAPAIKQPGWEADHSSPSRTEVKNVWRYASTPPICIHGVVFS